MRETATALSEPESIPALPERKHRIIEAAVRLILRQGYSGTTIDQICAEAGVTKGAFFHYFASKEEVGQAAIAAWGGAWQEILKAAHMDQIADPLDRLERFFEVMVETYHLPEPGIGCMIGTVAQETGASNRRLGDLCEAELDVWAAGVRQLLADAKTAHPPQADFDVASVADFMLGVVQGSLLVAKTRQDRAIIVNNVRNCRAYVLGLFGHRDASL